MLLRSRRKYATPILEIRNDGLYLVAIRDGICTTYHWGLKGLRLSPRRYWGGKRQTVLDKYVLTWLPNGSEVDPICEVLD